LVLHPIKLISLPFHHPLLGCVVFQGLRELSSEVDDEFPVVHVSMNHRGSRLGIT
jgi:hypothetical protein